MNGYKAFFKGREIEVYAETSYDAQKQAAVKFKARKNYEVSIVLCETDCPAPGVTGAQATHTVTA